VTRILTTLRFEAASGEWVFHPFPPSFSQGWRSTESFDHEAMRQLVGCAWGSSTRADGAFALAQESSLPVRADLLIS
jgi:hypothetical protein